MVPKERHFRSTRPYLILPSHHYASGWSQDREIRDFDSVTEVGVRYINETNPVNKEALLLELVRYFHSYIFKYVSMIVSGMLPKTGERINKDARELLRSFTPAGTKLTPFGLVKTARTLNLAFSVCASGVPAERDPQRLVVSRPWAAGSSVSRSNRSMSLPIAIAKASSFSNACRESLKRTVMRPGANSMPSGRSSNS
jgi:hypothetical protein